MARRKRAKTKRKGKRGKNNFLKFRPLLKVRLKLKPSFKKKDAKRNLLILCAIIGVLYWNPLHVQNPIHEAKTFLKQHEAAPPYRRPAPPVRPVIHPSHPMVESEPYEAPVKPVPLHLWTTEKTQIPTPTRKFSEGKPKIAIVIDDIGYTLTDHDLLEDLGAQVTYAILPLLPQSRTFGEISRRTGADVILHLPLESINGTIPGPGLITDRMSDDQIRELLDRDLNSVPNRIGVNNHMGSRGTSNPELMNLILGELKQRGLFFLDSYTTPQTVGIKTAKKIGMPVLKRDIFLDNEDNQMAVREKIEELAAIAREKGSAVGIGHYRYNTLKVLNEEIPNLKKRGFEVLSLSEMLHFQSSR